MKIFKFFLSFAFTATLFYLLNTSNTIGNTSVPPLGKFLDPFHGFWQNAENKNINLPTTERLHDLKAEVTVRYDSNLIPHIRAANNHDLYFAQGYVTASHRLWQMEFQTHAAAGRLSEIVGKATLDMDRNQRRIGMLHGAKNAYNAWKGDTVVNNAIHAYADGINAYIDGLDYKSLPIEYKLLGYKPEKWTGLKSALLLKYMASMLTGYERDLENTNTLALIGKEKYDFLFPDGLMGNDPVIPKKSQWDFQPVVPTPPDSAYLSGTTQHTIKKANPANGSNNWAVSGKKTKSGYPILANDMHLGLNFPSIWFMAQLTSPDVNVFGNTLPGTPLVITGFNDSIAWAFTNANRDLRDWYKIKFKDATKNEYAYDDGWRKSKKVIEEIKIKNAPSFYDTITYTHHGPVVYDDQFGENQAKTDYALKWLAHSASYEPKTFYYLNRAKNYQDYKQSIPYFECPPQNMTFASAKGDIATWVQGKFPIKWQGQGKFLLDGSKPSHEWGGFIPQGHNAHTLNPPRGFVSSANQHPVDSLYPYFVYNGGYEYYRNRRINQQLQPMQGITPADMMKLQNDTYSLKAAEILPILLGHIEKQHLPKEEKQLLAKLDGWDYTCNPTLEAPVIFDVWWKELYYLIWDEFIAEGYPYSFPNAYTTYTIMNKDGNNGFFDLQATESKKENLHDLIATAFKTATKKLKKREKEGGKMSLQWANYNNVSIVHLTKVLKSFSQYGIVSGGDGSAISANDGNHGVSQRLIVALGPKVEAWVILPGGQSGNPGSYFYDNMVPKWAKGKYLKVNFFQEGLESNPKTELFEQILIPKH